MVTTTRNILEGIQNEEVKPKMDNRIDKKLLGIAWDMWQLRNEALHTHQDNQPRILEAEVNQKVQELNILGPSASANGNTLLKHMLLDLLLLPHAYKMHWVTMATIAKTHQNQRKACPYHSKC